MTVVVSAVAHDVKAISCSHLVRDYQGSIMSQVDSTGFWHNDWSYDAWGRPRNPQTHVVYNPSALTTYGSAYRGYCGHEHLPQFGLINMNARLYDPITSRFLSPDPYVQMPDNTQSFNRYSYCLNNPTKYTDPNGELFLEILLHHYKIMWILGAIKGIKSHNVWESANRHVANDFKINIGLFTLDGNKNFGQKVWEAISRQTWQFPQSALGFVVAHGYNVIGDVRNVRHKYGVTVLSTKNLTGGTAVTIGNYITGSELIKPDANNDTFQHEYGHYIQSQQYGWAYLTAIGLPSLKSAGQNNNHKFQPYEVDANRRSDEYLTKNVATYSGWISSSHPLPSSTTPGYVNDKWYDYILGSPAMPIILGSFHLP